MQNMGKIFKDFKEVKKEENVYSYRALTITSPQAVIP